QMVPATTSLTGFSGETIWPLGQLRLLLIIGDTNHSTRAWMNFMIVREERTRHANFKVALHPDFPDQEVVIEGTLSDKGRTELCSILKKNFDIFAWQPSDMTGVPWSVAEHRLNIREGYSPVRQKKRGQAPERAKARGPKTGRAGIMREVFYHDWLSNPVMLNLDLLEERRERAAICEAKAKLKMTKCYNARVCGVTFKPGDFVYRGNDASHAVAGGKLGPKWEGPYELSSYPLQPPIGFPGSLFRFLWLGSFCLGEPLKQQISSTTLLLARTSTAAATSSPPASTGPEDEETAAPEVPPPENVITIGDAPVAGPTKRVAAADPPAAKERRKRGHDGVDTNTPPKVLRRDHADLRPTGSTREGKSLAAIELGMGSTRPTPALQGGPADVSDPDPLSFADPQSRPAADIAQ
nr:reverse transcriptase domain-containing protein [Tanacetum cinerariifolium]